MTPAPTARAHWSGLATAGLMVLLIAGAVGVRASGESSLSLTWVPSWDAAFDLRLDGLAFLYVLLAAGIGLVVTVYSLRYLPRHLEETAAPQARQPRFYALLVLFAVSMVGLATADDLLLLFVFWDLTAVASYFLIAFDREKQAARQAALTAILVTGITGVLLLVGAVMLWAEYGSFSLQRLFAVAESEGTTTGALGLIVVAGLAKSAQAPLHLWLPRAMTAPTPVSGYLHSAAMVAAGVLLIGRIYPLVAESSLLLDLLLVFGLASIGIGGILALSQDELKPILAYSTISQYGYVVVMYGLGGALAATAAALYVLGHAIEKSALFLTAGCVGQATHSERLSELGGLARSMPGLAVGSALAAAGVAALPLTLGFFQDELFFKTALERGWAFGAAAAAAATLTVVYIGRFWTGIFLGRRRCQAEPIPRSLVAPVVGLGAIVAFGGLVVGPFEGLAELAGESSVGSPVSVDPAYHLDLRTENVLALVSYGVGGLLLATFAAWRAIVAAAARLGELAGPTRIYESVLRGLDRASDRIHGFEVRDLRTRVAAVLLPAGLLAALGLLLSPFDGRYAVGGFEPRDILLVVALTAAGTGAVALTYLRPHLPLALLLGGVGYALAVVYAFFGAPDVALVAVLVETLIALVFFGVLSAMPAAQLRRESALSAQRRRRRRWRDRAIASTAGLFVFLVVWSGLSGPTSGDEPVGPRYPELAEEAHAKDAVTAILADFRGLDTIGEVSVVLVAMLGVVSMLRRGRLW